MIFIPSSLTGTLPSWRNIFSSSSSAKSPRHNLSSRRTVPSVWRQVVPSVTTTKVLAPGDSSSKSTPSHSTHEVPTITITKPPSDPQPNSERTTERNTKFILSEDEVRSVSLSGYYYRFQRPKRALLNRLMKNDHTILSHAVDRDDLVRLADDIDVDFNEEKYGAYGQSLRESRSAIYSLANGNHISMLGKEVLGLLIPPKDPIR